MISQITLEMVRAGWHACYEADRLAELSSTTRTVTDALKTKMVRGRLHYRKTEEGSC